MGIDRPCRTPQHAKQDISVPARRSLRSASHRRPPPGRVCPGRSQATSGWRSRRCRLRSGERSDSDPGDGNTARRSHFLQTIFDFDGPPGIVWRVPFLCIWSYTHERSAAANYAATHARAAAPIDGATGGNFQSARAALKEWFFGKWIQATQLRSGDLVEDRIYPLPASRSTSNISADKATRISSKKCCTRGKNAPASVTEHPECWRSNGCVGNLALSAWTHWVSAAATD